MAAVRHPDLFAGIVLIDPPILPARLLWYLRIMRWTGLEGMLPLAKGARRRMHVFRNKQTAFARFAAGRGIFKRWAPEFIDAYLNCGLLEKDPQTAILKCDPELEAQIFESIPTDIWGIVPRTPCPTLVIRGEMSDTLRPEAARRLRRFIPDCRLDIISGTGHFPPMEKPEDCAESIIGFVQERVPPLVGCWPPGAKNVGPYETL
jgi:pimeloyl-ACP methyl ester carboxylesterase